MFRIAELRQTIQLNSFDSKSDFSKVSSSYDPLVYFSDIFISGKNVVISAERWTWTDFTKQAKSYWKITNIV